MKTPNGYTVLEPNSPALASFMVGGSRFVVWAPALKAFRHLAVFLDAVEPAAEPGWDGGHAKRKIAGSDKWSEHAGGAAIDWNASQHPRNGDPHAGWTDAQVRMIRWYLDTTSMGALFDWGGDWRDPDPMHFQLKSRKVWDASEGWFKS